MLPTKQPNNAEQRRGKGAQQSELIDCTELHVSFRLCEKANQNETARVTDGVQRVLAVSLPNRLRFGYFPLRL
jgi:hypothetical protein